MKTKKVTLSKATASFSSAASHISTVTLPRAPWEPPDEPKEPLIEAFEEARRGPRHLGTYTRRVKT